MDISKRIAAARQTAGLNQSELARQLGITPQSVQMWESGLSKPRHNKLEALAKALGVSASYLLFGSPEGPSEHANLAPMRQPHRKPRKYPLISWVIAGERAESPDNFMPGDAEQWLDSTENAGEHGYWLDVKGNSMTSDGSPSFPAGVKILIQAEGFDVISGKFYIAKHRSGETTFKRYVRDTGTEYLVPLNPAYRTVEMESDWRLIGRVVDAKITGL